MVDVIKSLGFEYVCANPGSSFRGLQESLVNYGGNKKPEFLTCCHEESSVAMAHGYAKIEGKPMAVLAHGTVGLQHAVDGDLQRLVRSRAGLHHPRQHARRGDAAARASNGSTACRTPRRWCATTSSGTTRRCRCTHFAESAVRAYKIAMTPPHGAGACWSPTATAGRADCRRRATLRIPKLTLAAPPQGDSGAVAEAGAAAGRRPRIR